MLNIQNLSVEYYRRGQVIPAVRDLSLSLGAGETLGLVGESGSGKSTVALAILRLLRPQEGKITSGRILFQGEDLIQMSEDRLRLIRGLKISMIFQDPFTALNPVMRVREQMTEVLEAHSIPSSGDVGLAEALARVQLDPARVLSSYPHQLSGGQRQRVMIAIALLSKPDLLLADEPTTALDVLVQRDILDLLFDLQKQLKLSVLFISHNLALVAKYSQRMMVMKEGRRIEEGGAHDLFHAPKEPYTRELIASLRKLL